MAEDQAEDALQRHAARLLQDDGLKRVLTVLKERAIHDWANSTSNAMDAREERYRDIQAVGRLEGQLKALADGGKLDARKAEQKKRT